MKQSSVKSQLRRLGVRPRKERGQNFVIDPFLLERIVAYGDPQPGEVIIEIGPGLGALTEKLAARAAVHAIEIEPHFCRDLKIKLPQVDVVEADFLDVDLARFGKKLVVFGNIPYSASSDIVLRLVEQRGVLDRAILMVQREFAERMAAGPGGKEFGSFSVAVQVHARVTLGEIIPGSAFHPAPKVESRMVLLDGFSAERYKIDDLKWFERVVRAAFHQRRKKLSNTLRSLGKVPDEAIDAALAAAGIDGGRRAETVSIDEFAALARALKPA